ncbi:MAG: hypothetical protein IH621_16335, partial [Krumholzibacteria bacterium]|nr:hypothetical protein [Candidatus Krumholzibacteria bacterium]
MAVGKRIRGLPLPGLLAALLVCAPGCDSASVLTEAAPASTPWHLVSPRDFPVWLTAVWGDGPDHLLAVGSFGAVLVKEGATWREAPRPTTGSFYDLHGCDWQHVYGVTAEGLLFFDGRSWTRTGPADLGDGARVWCRAPDDVMVVTARGVSHHFDGAAWTRATVPVDPYWSGPGRWLTGTSDGYLAVGFRGAAYWRGGRWEPVPGATDQFALLAVCRADSAGSERYLAIDSGGVLELVRGAGWRRHAWLGGNLRDIVSGGGARAFLYDETGPSATIRSDTGDTLAPVTGVRPG